MYWSSFLFFSTFCGNLSFIRPLPDLNLYMFSEFSVSALEGPNNFCLQKSRMPLAGLVYLQLNLPKHTKVYTVACQRGGVSEEPPWLQAATRDPLIDPLVRHLIYLYKNYLLKEMVYKNCPNSSRPPPDNKCQVQ